MINNTHHYQIDHREKSVLIELIVNVQEPAYIDWELLTLDNSYRYPKICGAVINVPLCLVIDIPCLVIYYSTIHMTQK